MRRRQEDVIDGRPAVARRAPAHVSRQEERMNDIPAPAAGIPFALLFKGYWPVAGRRSEEGTMDRWRYALPIALTVVVGTLVAFLARGMLEGQEPPAPAKPVVVWEYKIMDQSDLGRAGVPDLKLEPGGVNLDALQKGLDKVGTEGWELAGINGQSQHALYIFKRPRAGK
jgi:hypothetical protein